MGLDIWYNKVRERILKDSGKILTFDQLVILAPLEKDSVLVQGHQKACEPNGHVGSSDVPVSHYKPFFLSKGRKLELAIVQLNVLGGKPGGRSCLRVEKRVPFWSVEEFTRDYITTIFVQQIYKVQHSRVVRTQKLNVYNYVTPMLIAPWGSSSSKARGEALEEVVEEFKLSIQYIGTTSTFQPDRGSTHIDIRIDLLNPVTSILEISSTAWTVAIQEMLDLIAPLKLARRSRPVSWWNKDSSLLEPIYITSYSVLVEEKVLNASRML
ncbi:RP-L18e [Lepeophtheirus salmonis]|uniref:Large ribosomal subunit protein eL18 n=1 Tax=Lepeophtheirus salmonis TaxID=72036 RepID=A0A7R8CWM5_LEPSM|nr:RP-L18e [Lepeophtheirus salmonis]CAF2953639.1 RP-L18e [Lepeophtheirus salmonis]